MAANERAAGPQWTVGPDDAGTRLDKFLADKTRLGSRGRALTALERRKVFVNDLEADIEQAALHLTDGDRVLVWMDRPGSSKRRATSVRSAEGLRIVYEDEALLVLDKPPGLLVVPLDRRSKATSVYELAGRYLQSHKRRPYVVHRIDRDTSGLVIVAKDRRVQRQLRAQFKRQTPERLYLAVVYGHPRPEAGTWRDLVVWDQKALVQRVTNAQNPHAEVALSRYRVAESFETASLLEVRLRTGKQNQIRLQANSHGHMLVGERRYVSAEPELKVIPFPRQALHASRLTLRHPLHGREVEFEAPLPEDFESLLATLRGSRASSRTR
jgi:23S rRNA pseudouridine1911/1915/1917 synthase